MSFDPFDIGLVRLRFWKIFCFAGSFETETVVEFWYEIAGVCATKKKCLHGILFKLHRVFVAISTGCC